MGYFLQPSGDQARVQLPYSEFKSHLKSGDVARVTLSGQEIRGELNQSVQSARGKQSSRHFRTLRPPVDNPDLMRLLDEKNVTVTAKIQ